MNEYKWLKSVCEISDMSDKDLVRFGQWYVNIDGDLFGNIAADKKEYGFDAYTIYSYQLKEKEDFESSFKDWLQHLWQKGWFVDYIQQNQDKAHLFLCAFAVAWHRSGKEDAMVYEGQELTYETCLRRGTRCVAIDDADCPKSKDRQDQQIIVEYNEKTHQFHHNLVSNGVPHSEPSDDWRPVAAMTSRVAFMFCALIRARIYNGALFTFDQVVAEWNYFLFTYYMFLDDADCYGMPEREDRDQMVDVQMRINYYEGNYADNEQMKLRTIGVPGIDKPEED